MSNTITQEDYDAEIKDLMESLDITEEEAIEDAVKCYEMQVLKVTFFIYIVCWSVKNILSFAIVWLIRVSRSLGDLTFNHNSREKEWER